MKASFVRFAVLMIVLALAFMPIQAAWAADAPQTAAPQMAAPLMAAPQMAAPEAPTLPDAVQLVIGAAVTFLVVAGLKDFLEFTGHDLTGWGTVIAAAITATIIFAINTAIQVAVTIDPSLVPKINSVLQILVILLGAMGFKRLQRANP